MRVMGTDSANVSEYLRLFDGIGDEKGATAPIGTISEKGDISVMLSNELALEHGRFGVSVDKKEAARYIKMTADMGNLRAMFNYSLLMMHAKNDDEFGDKKEDTVRYCKMSVDNGFVLAMHNYAMMLSHG